MTLQTLIFTILIITLLERGLNLNRFEIYETKMRAFLIEEKKLTFCAQDHANAANLIKSAEFFETYGTHHTDEVVAARQFLENIESKLVEEGCSEREHRGYRPGHYFEKNKNFPQEWPNGVRALKQKRL